MVSLKLFRENVQVYEESVNGALLGLKRVFQPDYYFMITKISYHDVPDRKRENIISKYSMLLPSFVCILKSILKQSLVSLWLVLVVYSFLLTLSYLLSSKKQ